MNNSDIDTSKYLPKLEEIISRYNVEMDIETVPNIQEWCSRNNILENNPFRVGKVLLNKEMSRFLVLLANPITHSMVSSVLESMLWKGSASEDEVKKLAEPLSFLTHLVLHEVAHALDEKRSEADCDCWAFAQIEIAD